MENNVLERGLRSLLTAGVGYFFRLKNIAQKCRGFLSSSWNRKTVSGEYNEKVLYFVLFLHTKKSMFLTKKKWFPLFRTIETTFRSVFCVVFPVLKEDGKELSFVLFLRYQIFGQKIAPKVTTFLRQHF